jgi:tellurite resistance protein TerC
MVENSVWFWIFFNLAILAFILIDLKFVHAKNKAITIKKALLATAFWIGLALVFNAIIYFTRGTEDALKFLTGYLVEYSLSIDNIFVFLILFTYFQVPSHLTHKVLFFGVLGAIIMRALFIVSGVVLIQKFSWLIYVLGIFLIGTGIKLWFSKNIQSSPEKNPVIRLFKRYFPVSENYAGDKFFIKRGGKLLATPLFIVLLAVETTDVIFALDSIPAIIGITTDIFLVYTSNIFAVLGLRSLYFALSGLMGLFHYLHYGLAIILVFIGLKMLLSGYFHLPIALTLGSVCAILAGSILLSLIKKNPDQS